MSTTTHQDKKAVRYLAAIAGEDPEKLGIALLERGMDLSGVSLDTLLSRDTKMFTLCKEREIAQVMVPSFGWNRERDAAITAGLGAGPNPVPIFRLPFSQMFLKMQAIYGVGDPLSCGNSLANAPAGCVA